ncbi:oxygen-independent coproporphyrinogen III oxidase [Campylobacter troglodytis]|uniref:oxygen-independent coproporphyrinogen III oxidase n=1 Tax=Campylobacter troglodytis TaxID=654363 RepID=UPI001157626C|nr:oxygen-independent coproporphyrinogen III oxidase [Campylobacter troglodytis]TQR61312.1 oxygen-independent coproporphyrinogen III oxidase [Campylobacter troglodytis]
MRDYKAFVKFSKPGPRYTSYPTAVEFSKDFSYEQYLQILRQQSKDLSLYFHLPFCRSACYFCGCNVIYTSKDENKERYLGYLFKELDLLEKFTNTKRKVVQMHFGGGTPTFFSANQLQRLIEKIKSIFVNFDKKAELSCEIDPRFLNEEQTKVLTENGFNRVSFGVQDFDERVQKEIHRIQSFELTQEAVNLVRTYGIKSVNMDLIYGLPLQSLKSFENTLKKGLELDPDRFAIFSYAHVPWLKKNMRKFNEKDLPGPNIKLEILEFCEHFLGENGYEMVGMDHFAKKDDELFKALKNGSLHRNFQGYTTKKGADLLGIGLTSIGEGQRHYAQNFKDMPSYENAIDNGSLPFERGILLDFDDELRKAVIMSLMANFSLDIKGVEARFGVSFFEYFRKDLELLSEYKHFYTVDKDSLKVNETGVLLIRNLAMCFDKYMKKLSEEKKVFSKTV